MKYNKEEVRRQDRLLEQARAQELLRTAEYGVLSMTSADGTPYGVPLNFVWDGASSLYIHCAPEGRKLQALAAHPDVSFCIVGRTHLLPDKFTTEYESLVLRGKAFVLTDEAERHAALRLLVEKLSADFRDLGLKYIEKSFHRTAVIRLDVSEYSGKCKRAVPSASRTD